MKKTIITLWLCMACMALWAQTAREEIHANIQRAGSNYLAYPAPTAKLSAAPKGYEPCYISHYGRHGSRYLIAPEDYEAPYQALSRADKRGVLTPLGHDVLARVSKMRDESNLRLGELTPLGAQQHREIAHRMYERFPQVFAGSVNVDAKSTVVIRCILSMENALQELKNLNPQINVTHDASEHEMWYMNHNDRELTALRWNIDTHTAYRNLCKKHINNDRLINSLFTDTDYVKRHINADDLCYRLFTLAVGLQSSELSKSIQFTDIFTEDEIYGYWLTENARWYIEFAACPLNGATQPYSQRYLLRQMIAEADSCLAQERPGATLRFGHESIILPLSCLLEMDVCSMEVDDLDQLADAGWCNYRIFPMGSNIQLIFYRSKKDKSDILVQALLNENEVGLPLQPADGKDGCFYRWSDFRKYYLEKIDRYERR